MQGRVDRQLLCASLAALSGVGGPRGVRTDVMVEHPHRTALTEEERRVRKAKNKAKRARKKGGRNCGGRSERAGKAKRNRKPEKNDG